jgi:hypothetical protein
MLSTVDSIIPEGAALCRDTRRAGFQPVCRSRADSDGFDACREVARRNAEDGVTWVHSYVTVDRRSTYCIYDARRRRRYDARGENRLPSSRIAEVRDLSPIFIAETAFQ